MTTGTGFIPIGKETSKTFNGNFNGNNYSINSIYINTEKIGGLFGCTNEATIKNTTIKGEITSTKEKAGGIIRDAKKTNVEKCINYATIITTNDNPTYISDGGISYTNSYSGGIAGSLGNDGIVNECINYGKIITNKTYAAGIVAFCDGIIMNSINYGEIITQGSIAAGIASFKYSGRSEGTIIINCANYGNIKSPYIGGGIWGQQIAGKVFIYNSYNLGNIQSEQIAGGIYGKTYLTTTTNITNCYNEGIVYGKTSTGGILGYVYGGTLSITNSYYLDNVEKEIGNIEQGTSIKYSSTEKEIVLSGLNNYIDSNSEITNEWLHWKIEDNNIVYENINK